MVLTHQKALMTVLLARLSTLPRILAMMMSHITLRRLATRVDPYCHQVNVPLIFRYFMDIHGKNIHICYHIVHAFITQCCYIPLNGRLYENLVRLSQEYIQHFLTIIRRLKLILQSNLDVFHKHLRF